MREKGVGGLPVMDTSGAKAIGNISIRDVQYLLTAPKIYKEHRFVVLIHPLLIGHVYDKKYKKKDIHHSCYCTPCTFHLHCRNYENHCN
jgi:CBS domain-containing protein